MKRIDPLASEARAGRRLLILIALAALAGLMLGISMGRAKAESARFAFSMASTVAPERHEISTATPADAAAQREHRP